MILVGTELFREAAFSNEREIEAVVEEYSHLLFGSSTIFLSKKMLVRTGDGRGTIPDAFVIDYQNSEWYLVEVELIEHGVWRHIVPQITNQIVACLNQDTRNLLTDRVLEYIENDKDLLAEPSIQQRVVSILRQNPTIAIPIDGSSQDLETWAQTQKLKISIWIIQKFESTVSGGRFAYKFPENSEPSIISEPRGKPVSVVRRAYSKNIAELIDAGLIQDGEDMFLAYRGKSFSGHARREGIELGLGEVHSPSEAAIRCYAKAGSTRPTENGWRVWKNKDGLTLNDLYEEFITQQDSTSF